MYVLKDKKIKVKMLKSLKIYYLEVLKRLKLRKIYMFL